MSEDLVEISLQDVKIGMYICLDLSWDDHPFMFDRFKVKNEEQLSKLQSMGLEKIHYIPGKSKIREENSVSLKEEMALAKKAEAEAARKARMEARRQKIEASEERYRKSLDGVTKLVKVANNQPLQAVEQADALVADMVKDFTAEDKFSVNLMEVKDTGGDMLYYHVLNVGVLSLMLGAEQGFTEEQLQILGLGAMFHDIGTIRLPSNVAHKKSELSAAEEKVYEQHARFGFNLMERAQDFPGEALNVIYQHHELMDGSGYPKGLKGNQISLMARVVCIANTYDNLCNHIDPRKSLPPAEALSYMYAQQKGKYDEELLKRFIRCLGIYPPGTIVQLSDGNVGIVRSSDRADLLRPMVMVYDKKVPAEEAALIDMQLQQDLRVTKNIRPRDLDMDVLHYLNPRTRLSYFASANEAKEKAV